MGWLCAGCEASPGVEGRVLRGGLALLHQVTDDVARTPESRPRVGHQRHQLGDRIALLGIGSGLNCTMAEVEW